MNLGLFLNLTCPSGVTSLYSKLMAIFSTGTNGYIYDPSDMASLNQLSTGLTPVTAVTQPVGLVLDKRLGLVLGPELVTNGTFDTGIAGWVKGAGTTDPISWSDGKLRVTNDLAYYASGNTTISGLTVGATYRVLTTNTSGSVGGGINIVGVGGTNTPVSVGVQSQLIFKATDTSHQVSCENQLTTLGGYTEWDNISVKLLDGNHALQATAAARPTWTNRVNLLTYTGQFDNAAWTKYQSSITANDTTAPDGTLTADRCTTTGFITATYIPNYPFIAGAYSVSIYFKSGTNTFPAIIIGSGLNPSVAAIFNLTDGTMSQSNAVGTGTILSTSIVSVGAGWYRCSMTFSGFSSAQSLKLEMAPDATGNTFSGFGDINNNVSGQYYYAWGAQVETGSTATTYQRVTTATDFDTVGFPYYLSFLGTDDSLTSATGGGGSAGFFWCGAVLPTGGAGTARGLFYNYSTPANGYIVLLSAANKLTFYAGNGSAFTTKASTATVDVGTKYLLTCWEDGTNLNVQINDDAVETVARPVVVAGPADFALGKTNGEASNFLIGSLYASVYARNTGLTASQRATIQNWVKQKAGIV